MVGPVRMNAAHQPRRFIRMAGLTLYRRLLFRMRILLYGSVTALALQRAVNAGIEFMSIHADAVPGCILHACVAMTRQAIAVPLGQGRRCGKQESPKRQRNG
jgi:hypothetical protein